MNFTATNGKLGEGDNILEHIFTHIMKESKDNKTEFKVESKELNVTKLKITV